MSKVKPAVFVALFGSVLLTWSVVLPVTGLMYFLGWLH